MKTAGLASFVTMLLACGLLSAPAEARRVRTETANAFELKHHELTVSTGIVPGRYSFGYNYISPFDDGSLAGLYESAAYYEREYTSGVWSLGYTYNFTKLLAVYTSISYERGWTDYCRRSDDALAARNVDGYLSAVASFKVNWFNRPMVRLYSYAGIGISFNHYSNDSVGYPGKGRKYHDLLFAGQVTPIGVTVGKSIFGFAELGLGTCFSGIAFGVGYRF